MEDEIVSSVPDLNDEVLQTPDTEKDLFEYIAGAVCRKFGILPTEGTKNQNRLISIKGGGKLIQPREEIVEMCRRINEIFNKFNGPFLKKCVDPIGSVVKVILRKFPSYDIKIVKYFCKMKFFSRIKNKNLELRLKKSTNVRFYKQTAQFVN